MSEKDKGCDIGYALATSSCEGANSVETCTVTAFWCDHRFRGPKPQLLLAEPSVFSGLAARRVTLPSWSLSLLRTGKVLYKPTLSAVDGSKLRELPEDCQRPFSVQSAGYEGSKPRNATHWIITAYWTVDQVFSIFAQEHPQRSKAVATTKECAQESGEHLDDGRLRQFVNS